MSIVFGVNPGGKKSFTSAALFFNKRLPASLISMRSWSSVDEVKNNLMGVVGEWGNLAVVAIDAPLSWSGTPNGMRACDDVLKKRLPAWAPRTWMRAPTALPGGVSLQGPALAWALADEIKQEQLPQHQLVETHARLSLVLACKERQNDLQKFTDRTIALPTRDKHLARLVEHFIESGLIRLETDPPKTPDELDAFVAAIAALGVAEPDSGLVTHTLDGGELRPAGKRPVVILEALP